MRIDFIFFLSCISLLPLMATAISGPELSAAERTAGHSPAQNLMITILYDNTVFLQGTIADWGFSCLVQGLDKTILFDTGTKPDILMHNIKKLGVKLKDIDLIVLSHEHNDHTGGLMTVLKRNSEVTVYAPVSFSDEFFHNVEKSKAAVVKVDKPIEICPGAHLTGEMGESIIEQGLVIDTPKGSVVILGCSHPGVDNMVRRAKEILNRDVYLVLGGFHMLRYSESQVDETIKSLRAMGVVKCGATHCTGDNVISEFKKAFAHDFITMGTGRIIEISR